MRWLEGHLRGEGHPPARGAALTQTHASQNRAETIRARSAHVLDGPRGNRNDGEKNRQNISHHIHKTMGWVRRNQRPARAGRINRPPTPGHLKKKLRLFLGRFVQLRSCGKPDPLVRRYRDELAGLSTSNRLNSPGFDLPHREGAESGEYNSVPSSQGLLYAAQHCIESCLSLSPGPSQPGRNPRSQVTLPKRSHRRYSLLKICMGFEAIGPGISALVALGTMLCAFHRCVKTLRRGYGPILVDSRSQAPSLGRTHTCKEFISCSPITGQGLPGLPFSPVDVD